jgi:hypothetical protein
VVGKRVAAGRHLVDIDLVEINQRSEVCAKGHATVALPVRGDVI